MTRTLRACGVAVAATLALVACAEVAKLDVAYTGEGGGDAGEDSRQKVRPSTTETTDADLATEPLPPTDLGGCDGGLGEGAGCDDSAGLGCCLRPTGSQCLERREAEARCGGGTFVACRQGNGDSACCWRAIGTSRFTAFAARCEEGATACLDGSGCPEGQACQTRDCVVGGTIFTVGACGSAAPRCPGEP